MDSKYVAGTPEIARFDFTHTNSIGVDKTQRRIELCAEHLWNAGFGDRGTEENPLTFADLTKKQKLDIVAQHLERTINGKALAQLYQDKQILAKMDAEVEFNNN